ncbi:MAG: hypothetical protein ACKO2L_16130 [Planctomycetaceae bacterium]
MRRYDADTPSKMIQARFSVNQAFPVRRRIRAAPLLMVLLMYCWNATVFAQKGSKPPRGGGQGGNQPAAGMKDKGIDRREYELSATLPAGYQHLVTDEVRRLELLVQNALGWIRETAAPVSGFRSAIDLFQTPADSIDTSDAEVRGLWMLSLLNLEQRKTLASILDDYRSLSAQREQHLGELAELLAAVRSSDSPSALRKLDTDSRRPLQEIAGIDAELGLLQARIFMKIARSLENQQSEAILLAIRGPAVPETATAEMQDVQGELRNTSADAARDLQKLGVNFASWLAPPASTVPPSQPAPADAERRGAGGGGAGGRDKIVDAKVLEFLAALGGSQQELVLRLLSGSARQRTDVAAALTTLQTALRPGPTARLADERALRSLAQHRAQLTFSAAAEETRAFETLRKSLSEAQKKHLGIAVNDKPKKKKASEE